MHLLVNTRNVNRPKGLFLFCFMMKVVSSGPVPKWTCWGCVFLPKPLHLAVQSVYPTKAPGWGEKWELIPKPCALLQCWVSQEEGGCSPHLRKHLLLSQPRSLDWILNTCPILGRASIQANRGSRPWPPFLLPLLHFVALNLPDFSFAEKFESIVHTNKQGIWHLTSAGRSVYFKRMPRRRPFSIHRNKLGWRIIRHHGGGFFWGGGRWQEGSALPFLRF